MNRVAPALKMALMALITTPVLNCALLRGAIVPNMNSVSLDRQLRSRTVAACDAFQIISSLSCDPHLLPPISGLKFHRHHSTTYMAPHDILDAAMRSYSRSLEYLGRAAPDPSGAHRHAESRLLANTAWFGRYYDPKPMTSARFRLMISKALVLDPLNARAIFTMARYYYDQRAVVPDPNATGYVTMTIRNAAGRVIKRSTSRPTEDVYPDHDRSKAIALVERAISLAPKFPEAVMLKWDILAFPPGRVPKGKGGLLVAVLKNSRHQDPFLDGGSKWAAAQLRSLALDNLRKSYPKTYNNYEKKQKIAKE